ncbi:carbohydrate-binding protein [Cohnella sp. AR92]|uniref:carbohydrate-binding protein n=1 Tax=Cohnella sp. AR92 TaxID=648716 RepID=UPI000F8CC284|nr:carbohydrate-binding protein [Cohnella sp. AR92]RUS43813.1 carbohydrate-binding protein [Cohnella sp. AR92]
MRIWRRMLALTIAIALAFALSPAAAQVKAATSALTPALAKTPGNANPLFTQKFGADPYAMVYDGRVYVYMTNDVFEYNADGTVKDNGYGLINKITVVSSSDMVNWTDHGEILAAGSGGAAKWATNSWAPAAAHKTIDGKEKFFLYFADSANGIGVLTADSPIGPFTDPIGKALVNRSTPGASNVTWLFDPAVLVDDDGSGYLYFGGGVPTGKDADPGTARVAKLGADMTSLDLAASDGAVKPINPPWLFEDSGIHKYNGKYYYSYCTNFSGGHPADIPTGTIAYMVSDNPMGPFTYVKTILPNPATFFGVGGNNHHSIFEFNGEWYITYHAQTLAKAMAESGTMPQMGGQPHGYRNAHINKVSFDANGVIQNIVGDYAGVPQVQTLDPYSRVEAETIGWNGGISTEKNSEPGGMVSSVNLDVTGINDGDWTAVSQVDFGDAGAGTFTASVASASSGGTIELHLDSADGKLIGTLPISSTGGASSWQSKTTGVQGATGIHDLYLVYRGASADNLFKIDYWQFAPASAEHELAAINASIDKQKIDIVPGTNTANLTVTAVYADGATEDVTAQAVATPAPSGIVSVSGGVVTGTGYGSASIGISYGGVTDTVHLLVKDLNSELTAKKITVDNGGSVTLDSGKTAKFKVTAEYMDGHTEDVTAKASYSNPSPAVADVSNGTITAKSSGTTTVVVSYRGGLGEAVTAQIAVTVNTPAFVAIEAETAAGNTADAYATGTINDHSWSVVDGLTTQAMYFGPNTGFAASATDAASLATYPKLGYKINFPASGTYNVWILVKTLGYDSDSVHVGLDNVYKFTANGIEGVSTGQYKWANISGSSGGIFGGTTLNVTAGVHELNFWGREDGLAIDRIYLTTGSATTDPVWPSPAVSVTGVTLDKSELSLEAGATGTLTATVAPENAANKAVTFASSDSKVATVTGETYDSATGTTSVTVHAIAAGNAVITATTADGGWTATSAVTVTPVQADVPTASLSTVGSVKPGGSFAVSVSLDHLAQRVYAHDISLSYDADVFEYVNAAAAGANENIQIVTEDTSAPGAIRLIAVYIGGVTGDSTPVLNLTFKAKAGVQNTSGTIAVTESKLGVAPEGTVIDAALSSKSISVGSNEPVVDKSALTAAIAAAQELYDSAVVGSAAGQYPQAAKDAFGTAINAAKAVNGNSGATQSEVDSAVTALNGAINDFTAAVVIEPSADLNHDGSINVGDLAIVAYYYGKTIADADWPTVKFADVNGDNKIDISDLAYVATKILK